METTNKANALSSPRAHQLAEAIAGRLFNDGAVDLSDSELTRVLAPCVGGMQLANAAKQLRDAGLLTLAEEWIAKRHRHAAEPGAVCNCDTPDVTALSLAERLEAILQNVPITSRNVLHAVVFELRTIGERDAADFQIVLQWCEEKLAEVLAGPDVFCAICHEAEFDANGFRHADVSSGHTFTPEGPMEVAYVEAREIVCGDVILTEHLQRYGVVTSVHAGPSSFAVRLDGEDGELCTFAAGQDDYPEVAVLRERVQ